MKAAQHNAREWQIQGSDVKVFKDSLGITFGILKLQGDRGCKAIIMIPCAYQRICQVQTARKEVKKVEECQQVGIMVCHTFSLKLQGSS